MGLAVPIFLLVRAYGAPALLWICSAWMLFVVAANVYLSEVAALRTYLWFCMDLSKGEEFVYLITSMIILSMAMPNRF